MKKDSSDAFCWTEENEEKLTQWTFTEVSPNPSLTALSMNYGFNACTWMWLLMMVEQQCAALLWQYMTMQCAYETFFLLHSIVISLFSFKLIY